MRQIFPKKAPRNVRMDLCQRGKGYLEQDHLAAARTQYFEPSDRDIGGLLQGVTRLGAIAVR